MLESELGGAREFVDEFKARLQERRAIRKSKERLMLRVKYCRRDGGGGLGSRCEACDCQGQLGCTTIKKVCHVQRSH
jgi:hypothetical protein